MWHGRRRPFCYLAPPLSVREGQGVRPVFTEPHVDLLPCCRCGHVPGWMDGEGPGYHRRIFLSCSYRCGGDDGVISLDYPDPDRTPPLVRLRLVRAHRWRPVAQVAADVARHWNNVHRLRGRGHGPDRHAP